MANPDHPSTIFRGNELYPRNPDINDLGQIAFECSEPDPPPFRNTPSNLCFIQADGSGFKIHKGINLGMPSFHSGIVPHINNDGEVIYVCQLEKKRDDLCTIQFSADDHRVLTGSSTPSYNLFAYLNDSGQIVYTCMPGACALDLKGQTFAKFEDGLEDLDEDHLINPPSLIIAPSINNQGRIAFVCSPGGEYKPRYLCTGIFGEFKFRKVPLPQSNINIGAVVINTEGVIYFACWDGKSPGTLCKISLDGTDFLIFDLKYSPKESFDRFGLYIDIP